MKLHFKDITNRTFGKLTAVWPSELRKGNGVTWFCVCECGGMSHVSNTNLVTGNTTSCGCFRRELMRLNLDRRSHGHRPRGNRTPTYSSWTGMRSRCLNPNATGYANYGGRGITVCERWLTFENFLADMGERPPTPPGTHGRYWSIDRLNVNGNYEPANCRWATRKEQGTNRRPARAYIRRLARPYIRNGKLITPHAASASTSVSCKAAQRDGSATAQANTSSTVGGTP